MSERIGVPALSRWATDVLMAVGVPEGPASVVAYDLVRADGEGLSGHGLSRLPLYVRRIRAGLVNPRTSGHRVRGQGAVGLWDGEYGIGQVVARAAMEETLALATRFGVGVVVVRRSTHLGVAGHVAEEAALRGYVGMVLTNTPPAMAPYGGRDAWLGTNPVAVAVPRGEAPLVMDLSTSVVPRGRVVEAARRGESLAEGWALDAEGRETTDPHQALKGSLLPVGGGKGYALALAVEVLSGVLPGAGVGPGVGSLWDTWDRPQDVGHFLLALRPGAVRSEEEFAAGVEELCRGVLGVRPRPGQQVTLPGDRRRLRMRAAEREGILLAPETVRELESLAREVGGPPFPGTGA